MNHPKDEVRAITDAPYVILGGSGNTGSIIANFLLSKGEKARVVGRDAGLVQQARLRGRGAPLVAELHST